MNALFQSLRAPFVSVTLSGVLLGTAAAYFVDGTVDPVTFFIVILVVVAGHISANLFNDFFDHLSGNDGLNKNVTPFSGGSRAIQGGGFRPFTVLFLACFFLFVASVAGFWFVYFQQNLEFAFFGAAGLFLGYAYTAPPFKLVYRGFGEAIIVITFGLFIVGGAFFAQTGNIFSLPALSVWLPAGLLTANILLVNTFPDRAADELVQKRTFIVRFGTKKAMLLSAGLVLLSYVVIIGAVFRHILPVGTFASVVSLPIAFLFLKKLERIEEEYLPAGVCAIALQIAFTVSAALGIFVSTVFS
jgi:1,4-dihydroxy-2-naphthoate octaprenyltransferase